MRYAIIENGKVINVIEADENYSEGIQSDTANTGDAWDGLTFTKPEENNLFVTISMSGGDGRTDPIGVANDGIEALSVGIAIKDKTGATVPISGSWRITLRHEDGSVYEILAVTITNGLASFSYTTTGRMGEVSINDYDLTEKFPINGKTYGLKVAGSSKFKVYRKVI